MSGDFGVQTASGYYQVSATSKEAYDEATLEQLTTDAAEIVGRYPQARSALLPMLHLIQSVDGYVTGRGIRFCAQTLELSEAEVSGVATFYTQYKRHPNGEYTVGVCTNTLCAIMGGDEIWDTVSEHLGVGHDETTDDGKITLERIECNAACDFAPVVMANWEFFDHQTPQSTVELVEDLRAGRPVAPTRGPNRLCTFKEVSRTLAGFDDGLADEGVGAGLASQAGLAVAAENGWVAPGGKAADHRVTIADVDAAAAPGSASTPAGGAAAAAAKAGSAKKPAKLVSSGKASAPAVAPAPRGDFEDAGFGDDSAKPAADGSGPAGWTIKGNEDSMLYHTVDSPWYDVTKAEVWFKDEPAAQAAGFTEVMEHRRVMAEKRAEAKKGKA